MCLPSALTETYEGRSCNSQMYLERSHDWLKSEHPGALLPRMAPRVSLDHSSVPYRITLATVK